MAYQYQYGEYPPEEETQQQEAYNEEVFPLRINVCLPGAPQRLLPIPLARLYSVEHGQLMSDFVDVLDYTVQLLLETASHLSPTERERMGNAPPYFIHPDSGLLIHTARSFANFAFECILTEHNSPQPLVISPQWPSVFFDENGFPTFCDNGAEEEQGQQQQQQQQQQYPTNNNFESGGPPTVDSLVGENIEDDEEGAAPPPPETNYNSPHDEQQQQPQSQQEQIQDLRQQMYHQQPYVSKIPQWRHISLDMPPDEYVTLTMPRL